MSEKPGNFRSKWIKPVMPYFVLALMIIAAVAVVFQFSAILEFLGGVWSILRPFFYGFVLAYLLDMPRNGIERLIGFIKFKKGWFFGFFHRRKKGISIVTIYVLFVAALYAALSTLIPYIVSTIMGFVTALPSYIPRIQELIGYVNEILYDIEIFELRLDANLILNGINDFVAENFNMENLMAPVGAVIGMGAGIFNFVLTFISSIFIMIEKERISIFFGRFLRVFTPKGVHSAIINYSGRLNNNVRQYIKVQTLDGMILGTIVTLQLALIIRTEYFLILGLTLALFNYIPYLGSIVASAIAILVVMITQGFQWGLITAGILLVTQQIDGNVIQPKLMGGSFKISPLLIILSVLIGNAIAGILGMILAIPILAVLKDILENITVYYEKKKLTDNGLNRE